MSIENSIRNSLNSRWSIVILGFIWLIPGLVGHDPWKADEPYSFGMVYHIITTGDWVVPTVAAEPFMEKPPIFYLTASVLARSFYPLLPLHDGARLACALFMIITFIFTGLAARELYGKGHGRIAVLILMGSVGLVNHAHKIMTDVSLLAGFAVAIYGLILSRRRMVPGGLLTGTGVGIGFMSKGLLAPGLLGVIAVILPFWCKEWKNRTYLLSLGIALLSVLPWLVIWPFALYQKAPDLFREWFWIQNFGRFFGYAHSGPVNEPAFYLFHLPYFAWPAFPLALLTFWHQWRSGKGSSLRSFPLAAFIVMLLILSFASDARVLYALPMLVPLSLLAVPAVDDLTPALVRISNRVFNLCFAFLASMLWLGWILLLSGHPSSLVARLMQVSPSHIPSVHPLLFISATLVTLLWLGAAQYRTRSGEGLLFSWTSGLTLVWALLMTLWLPFMDDTRSYRSMVLDLKKSIPVTNSCIAGENIGESERAMFDYFGGIRTVKIGSTRSVGCDLLLVEEARGRTKRREGSDWKKIWEGRRPGHEKELFILYQPSLQQRR